MNFSDRLKELASWLSEKLLVHRRHRGGGQECPDDVRVRDLVTEPTAEGLREDDSDTSGEGVSPEFGAISKLAFEQGLRGLDAQGEVLASLRQRASMVAGLNVLAATFLGGMAVGRAGYFAFQWAGLFFLVASFLAILQVIRPRAGWISHFGPSLIVDRYARGPKATSLAKTHEHLARFAEQNYRSNEKTLRVVFRWLVASFVGFLAQTYCWVMMIVS